MSKELELLRRTLEFLPKNRQYGQTSEWGNTMHWELPYKTEAERLRYESNRAAERLERAEALMQEIEALLGKGPRPPLF